MEKYYAMEIETQTRNLITHKQAENALAVLNKQNISCVYITQWEEIKEYWNTIFAYCEFSRSKVEAALPDKEMSYLRLRYIKEEKQWKLGVKGKKDKKNFSDVNGDSSAVNVTLVPELEYSLSDEEAEKVLNVCSQDTVKSVMEKTRFDISNHVAIQEFFTENDIAHPKEVVIDFSSLPTSKVLASIETEWDEGDNLVHFVTKEIYTKFLELVHKEFGISFVHDNDSPVSQGKMARWFWTEAGLALHSPKSFHEAGEVGGLIQDTKKLSQAVKKSKTSYHGVKIQLPV